MDYERLPKALKDFFTCEEEGGLRAYANKLKDRKDPKVRPMHGSVMPRTYVGKDYGFGTLGGKQVPKILLMAINQGRGGQASEDDDGFDPDKVRDSLYEPPFKDDKISPNGYGPRALALNLGRWIFKQCGVEGPVLEDASAIHNQIAYDNFVKWPFNRGSSRPPKDAWPEFYSINRAVVETLKPDIVLCLGHPMYDHLSNALKEKREGQKKPDWSEGYAWLGKKDGNKHARTGWCGTLKTRWGQCQLGWCYHYSNPIWPNQAWKELQDDNKIPSNLETLLDGPSVGARELVKDMNKFGPDDSDSPTYPWWGPKRCADGYGHIGKYNPYQKFVAWKVCKAVTCGWQAHHNQSTKREQ